MLIAKACNARFIFVLAFKVSDVVSQHAHWRGGDRFCPPHLFFANNLKTTARSAAKFGIPAHNSRTHLVCKF